VLRRPNEAEREEPATGSFRQASPPIGYGFGTSRVMTDQDHLRAVEVACESRE